jgi:hypothetical protein
MTIGTRLRVIVDSDDPKLGEYEKISQLPYQGNWATMTVNYELKGMNAILNSYALTSAEDSLCVGFMGDDHLPRTVGWDGRLAAAIAPREGRLAGVAYGNDLFQGENLPTAVVMTASIVRGLGYMAPPALQHMYLDNFWKRLGSDLGHLVYMPEVVIEHLHPFAGKATMDDGYKRVNTQEMYDDDQARFTHFLATQWPSDLAHLQTMIKTGLA